MNTRIRTFGLSAGAASLLAVSRIATAHVEYVVDEPKNAGPAVEFFVETISEPTNAALLGVGTLAAVLAVAGYVLVRPFRTDVKAFQETVADYREFLPWLIRLSMGLSIVGAGSAGYIFSPSAPADVRLLLVAIGFLILFGLANRVAALAGLALYVRCLLSTPELLLAMEFAGGLLAVVLLGGGRPSAAQLLRRVARTPGAAYGRLDPVHSLAKRFDRAFEPYEPYVPTLVRVSLGLQFVYLGLVEKLANPGLALAVVEKYNLTAVVPVDPALWVVGAGLTEIAVGLALLVGFLTRGFTMIAFVLFTLTLFGLPDDPVLAHLSLFGLASALLITGSGPYAIDSYLARSESSQRASATTA